MVTLAVVVLSQIEDLLGTELDANPTPFAPLIDDMDTPVRDLVFVHVERFAPVLSPAERGQ